MYEALYLNSFQKDNADSFDHFLNTLGTGKLSTDQITFCDIELTEKYLYGSIKRMKIDKSPGNDGLTKKCYKIL